MANFKYKQLADQIREAIQTAALAPGQRLPTEEALAEQYSLSRNTVRQALKLLEEEGHLFSVQGSGTFVAGTLPVTPKSGAPAEKRVAVVMNNFGSYIFPSVLMGVSDYLFEHGYSLILRIAGNHIAKEEQILHEVLESNVSGLIIEPARASWPRPNYDLYRRIEEQMPCVLTHSRLPDFRFASIGVSDVEGVALLVDTLVENGHTAIAAICKSDEQTGVNRFVGYCEGLRRNNLVLEEKRVLWFVDDEFEDLCSDANAARVFTALADCTAVVCFNDQLVSRFYPFLERHNIRVPEDISVVGFDDSIDRRDIKPLTTVVHPKEALGRAAAKALLTLIDRPDAVDEVSMLFPPQLVLRETVLDRTASRTMPISG
ncbi:MAG: GntR family transcriptional regulator [Planctomycetaceae bacterium]|nr:GntR family transcriptional regulator [Planctomycetaceae bacterium]